MRVKAAFAIAAALATLIAMLLPIPRDSDGGAAHAAGLPFSQG
jgi:hypothetical protein